MYTFKDIYKPICPKFAIHRILSGKITLKSSHNYVIVTVVIINNIFYEMTFFHIHKGTQVLIPQRLGSG
jgi:hypothetical protein